MIQKLIGERSPLSMAISIVVSMVVMLLSWSFGAEVTGHWLIQTEEVNALVSKVLSVAALIGVSLLFRDLQGRMKLSLKRGYFQPVLLALLVIPITAELSFVQISAIGMVTLAMLQLVSTHRVDKPEQTIQRLGIACGTATLLYPPMVWSLAVCSLIGIRLRQRSWRKGAIFILGFLFPFVMLFTFLLAVDQHVGKLDTLMSSFVPVSDSGINFKGWIPALAILAFVIFKPMGERYQAGLIPIREMELLQSQLIWLGGFIILGITGMLDANTAFITAMVPLAGLASISLDHAKQWWIPDLVVVILLSSFLLK